MGWQDLSPQGECGDSGGYTLTSEASPHPQEQGGSKGSSKWDRLAWVESQLQYFLAGWPVVPPV